jgi:mRNA interferase MazF
MTGCDVWDIVKVPFPYTNRPIQQYRPALVVARLHDAGMPELLWVLMITSATHRRWPGDVDITGLPAPSMVRCAKIATIEAKDATTVGRLSDRWDVEGFLRHALALPAGI